MAYPNLIDIRKRKKRSAQDSYAIGGFEQNLPPPPPRLYKRPAIFGVNLVLGLMLLITIFLSMFSYFCVTFRENRLKELHSATNQLNYENIELQNRVDSLKSFYVIDNKVQNINFLKKPDKVIEIKGTVSGHTIDNREETSNIVSVSGY